MAAHSVRAVPGAEIEYIAVVREETLAPVENISGQCRILAVVRIEGVRLLDTMALTA
jgi:pantothenate synthetase